jgi:hypothetical protein
MEAMKMNVARGCDTKEGKSDRAKSLLEQARVLEQWVIKFDSTKVICDQISAEDQHRLP